MENLQKRNYESTVKRGLINQNTTIEDFLLKLYEEIGELHKELLVGSFDKIKLELADVILVSLNFAYHYEIDIMEILEKKISINENR